MKKKKSLKGLLIDLLVTNANLEPHRQFRQFVILDDQKSPPVLLISIVCTLIALKSRFQEGKKKKRRKIIMIIHYLFINIMKFSSHYDSSISVFP